MGRSSVAAKVAVLWDELGDRCIYCQQQMLPKPRKTKTPTLPPLYPTVEHVIPVYFGGENHQGNLVLACYQCNHIKSNSIIHLAAFEHPKGLPWLFTTKNIKQFFMYPERFWTCEFEPTEHLLTKPQLLDRTNHLS